VVGLSNEINKASMCLSGSIGGRDGTEQFSISQGCPDLVPEFADGRGEFTSLSTSRRLAAEDLEAAAQWACRNRMKFPTCLSVEPSFIETLSGDTETCLSTRGSPDM